MKNYLKHLQSITSPILPTMYLASQNQRIYKEKVRIRHDWLSSLVSGIVLASRILWIGGGEWVCFLCAEGTFCSEMKWYGAVYKSGTCLANLPHRTGGWFVSYYTARKTTIVRRGHQPSRKTFYSCNRWEKLLLISDLSPTSSKCDWTGRNTDLQLKVVRQRSPSCQHRTAKSCTYTEASSKTKRNMQVYILFLRIFGVLFSKRSWRLKCEILIGNTK